MIRIALLLVLAHISAAQAALGGGMATVREDFARFGGRLRTVPAPLYQVHEIQLADGGSIREYAAADGTVFAVAWSTRFKPALQPLLGQRAADYAAASRVAAQRPGIKRSLVLRRQDLVVNSTSHLNAFVGRAYAPSLVPAGVDVNELR